MTRKEFLSIGPAAIAGASVKTGRAQTSSRGGKRPKNVLLLMSDQHKHRCLSSEGEPVAKTPNLDALARTSTRFDSAYCTNPVCTPSRASLLTGLYTHNHRAYGNSTPWPFEIKTVAHHFSRAGYMSGLVGKMHFVDAQTHGFDYHLGFDDWLLYLGPKVKLYADELGQANSGSGLPEIDDMWRDFGDPWIGTREKDGRHGSLLVGQASKMAERDQFDSFVARETVRFLKEHGKEQPFFLVSSFLKPHDPFTPAGRFADMFRPEEMTLPDTWGKVDLATAPKEIQKRIGSGSELKDPAEAKRRIAMYYANLAQMDNSLGQVLAALKELGLEDDTIVVYTSDHGEMLGEHGLWHKFVFYEPSVAVPLMFRVPGLTEADARSKTHVSLTQVMPTLLDLCGVPVPSGLDGDSLAADLREPGRTRDTAVFSEFNLRNSGAKYMIRRGDYKLNYWVNDMPELFNLKEDPKEMKNLALLPEHKGRFDELKSQLFAWYKPPEKSVSRRQ
jgi:choline-sulfatase